MEDCVDPRPWLGIDYDIQRRCEAIFIDAKSASSIAYHGGRIADTMLEDEGKLVALIAALFPTRDEAMQQDVRECIGDLFACGMSEEKKVAYFSGGRRSRSSRSSRYATADPMKELRRRVRNSVCKCVTRLIDATYQKKSSVDSDEDEVRGQSRWRTAWY